MKKFIDNHPLAAVMIAAGVFRLLAVVFSKGYMASDDHFQTVHVAYQWLQQGFFGADGYMTWKRDPAWEISRFPLYTVSLFWSMKLMYALGFEALDKIMYGVRLFHGLFSMLGVWAVYRIIELVTKSKKWAVAGGMVMAIHFVMPYLAVRNLIEMVGGTLWVLAVYYLYRYRDDKQTVWLVLAGIVTGLAWMVRFQLLLAFWVIPIILWIDDRRIRAALYYGLTLLGMFLIAGLVDWKLMGTFMGTTLNHIGQGFTERPPYATNIFIYIGVILGYFIPPLSLILFYLAGRKSFVADHKMITISSLAFVVIHSLLASRQERYMIPIVPVLAVVLILAMHRHYCENGFLFRKKRLFYPLLTFTISINTVLLLIFTFNYGHKGMVEPLVKVEQVSAETPKVLFFSPDKYRNFPYFYGGFDQIGRNYVFHWPDFDRAMQDTVGGFYDYYMLYPLDAADLGKYVDTLENRVGPMREVFHVGPSLVDYILHLLNPKHNRTHEGWVYAPVARFEKNHGPDL
ncbi:MAG: glycosyltransferase family 39 protein [candidate division Zixibacteria bacterium]|nr:glycosyltransferase family 39 protein [candidate division Zixibacteria bacterium]